MTGRLSDMHTLDLGGLTVSPLIDIESLDFAVGDLLPDAGPGVAGGRLSLRFQGFLVRTAERTIIVDTGVGRGKDRTARPAWHRRTSRRFLDELAGHGLVPGDVDVVMATHLHADHVGWHTEGMIPTFSRARHLFVDRELEYWQRRYATDPGVNYGSYADSVLPILGGADHQVVSGGHQIAPGVAVEVRDGHTPGTCVVRLTGRERSAVICGDIIHHPVQLAQPDVCSRFCVSPGGSRRVRRELIEEACESGIIVLPAHWTTGPARLEVHRGRVRAEPVS